MNLGKKIKMKSFTKQKHTHRHRKHIVTKGTFHAKMGSIKDRNGMDLTEAENIRGGRNTQNCTKMIFMTQVTTMV